MILQYEAGQFSLVKVEPRHRVRWVSWKKNSKTALLTGDGGLVLNFDGEKFAKVDSGIPDNLRCSDYNPVKTLALLVGNKGAILAFESGKPRRIGPPTEANLRRVSWSPDGSSAMIVGNAGTILVSDGAVVREVGGATANLRSITWHPLGEYALLSGNYFASAMVPSPTLYRYEKGASEVVPLKTTEKTDLISVDWKPDGTHALAVGYEVVWQESRVYRWNNHDLELLALQDPGLFLTAVAWHPTAGYALVGSGSPFPPGQGEGVILEFREDGFRKLYSSKNRVGCIAWRPDGKCAWIVGAENFRTFFT